MNSKSVSGYFGGSEDLDRFRFKLDSNLWRDKLLKTSGYWKLFLMISSAKENGTKLKNCEFDKIEKLVPLTNFEACLK